MMRRPSEETTPSITTQSPLRTRSRQTVHLIGKVVRHGSTTVEKKAENRCVTMIPDGRMDTILLCSVAR
jgi:hypothetical protein